MSNVFNWKTAPSTIGAELQQAEKIRQAATQGVHAYFEKHIATTGRHPGTITGLQPEAGRDRGGWDFGKGRKR